MGFWRSLTGPTKEQVGLLVNAPNAPIKSPWTASQLRRVAVAELAGLEPDIVSRLDAMRIPAVARARGLICGTLSRYPLTLWRYVDGKNDEQLQSPAWMTSTTTRQSPISRMLWSLDDMLFGALSVWAVKREGEAKAIVDAIRIPPENWTVDPDSMGILVNGELAKDDEILIIEGPQDGLLTMADGAIRASRNLANAWGQRVKSPVPLVAIKQVEANVQLDDDEIDDIVIEWEDARAAGGTAFIPFGFDIEGMGNGQAPDLYVEGRNAERLDWANFVGLPAAMLDGSMSTATLTYSTSEGKRSEFVDFSLNYWASAVEARLSQDDVTPEGTYVRFDISWLVNPTQTGTNPGSED